MFILWYRIKRKKFNFDPIDKASIDKTEFWVVEDEEPPFLDHEEIENEDDDDDASGGAFGSHDDIDFNFLHNKWGLGLKT